MAFLGLPKSDGLQHTTGDGLQPTRKPSNSRFVVRPFLLVPGNDTIRCQVLSSSPVEWWESEEIDNGAAHSMNGYGGVLGVMCI